MLDANETVFNFQDNISWHAKAHLQISRRFDIYFRKSQKSHFSQNFEKCKTF